MVHNTPTLDPLLAGLVSAFIITAVIITLLLFLKLRRRDNRPEFRRLQDLPMVSTSTTPRRRCGSLSLCGDCHQPRAPFHRPHSHGGHFPLTSLWGGEAQMCCCCVVGFKPYQPYKPINFWQIVITSLLPETSANVSIQPDSSLLFGTMLFPYDMIRKQ